MEIKKFNIDDRNRPYESLRLQISKASEVVDIRPSFLKAVSVNHLLSLIVKQALDLMEAGVLRYKKVCFIALTYHII